MKNIWQIPQTNRDISVDLFRTLCLLIMSFSHSRSYIFFIPKYREIWYAPAMYTDNLVVYFRIISHFTVSGFFILLGIGSILFYNARKNKLSHAQITSHLSKRGVALLITQFLLGHTLNLINGTEKFLQLASKTIYEFNVLSALGVSLICASFLLKVRSKYLIMLSAFCILFTQWITLSQDMVNQPFNAFIRAFFLPGYSPYEHIWVSFSWVPWFSMALVGMVMGRLIIEDIPKAYKTALIAGIALFGISILLLLNGSIWTDLRPDIDRSIFSFLQVTKYPPSLMFFTRYVGLALIILWICYKIPKNNELLRKIVIPISHCSLFFFITHYLVFKTMSQLIAEKAETAILMLFYWFIGAVICYILCRFYTAFKFTKKPTSIWRYF